VGILCFKERPYTNSICLDTSKNLLSVVRGAKGRAEMS
jgi:hypothetical protein